MTTIADEVRAWTARSELHPLVAENRCSTGGLCLESWQTDDGDRAWCDLDYLHEGPCANRAVERELSRLGATLDELGGIL